MIKLAARWLRAIIMLNSYVSLTLTSVQSQQINQQSTAIAIQNELNAMTEFWFGTQQDMDFYFENEEQSSCRNLEEYALQALYWTEKSFKQKQEYLQQHGLVSSSSLTDLEDSRNMQLIGLHIMRKSCHRSQVALECDTEDLTSSLDQRLRLSLSLLPAQIHGYPSKARRELKSVLHLFNKCTDNVVMQGLEPQTSQDTEIERLHLTTMAKIHISREGRRKINEHLAKIKMIVHDTAIKVNNKVKEMVIESEKGIRLQKKVIDLGHELEVTGRELKFQAKMIGGASYCAYVNYWQHEKKSMKVALFCRVFNYGNGTIKEQIYAVGKQVQDFNEVIVKRGAEIGHTTYEGFKIIHEMEPDIEEAFDYTKLSVQKATQDVFWQIQEIQQDAKKYGRKSQ